VTPPRRRGAAPPAQPALGRLGLLPGIGPAREARLARLGLATIRDLLFLIPRRLEVFPGEVPIAEARRSPGRELTIAGLVRSKTFYRSGRRRSVLRVAIADPSGAMDIVFFNQPWLRERFAKGGSIRVHGRVVDSKGPALAATRLESDARALPEPGSLVATYPSTEGISQGFLRELCRAAARRFAERLVEPLPEEELSRLELPPLPRAVRDLHEPADLARFEAASRRVALEPVLRLQARLWERRKERAEGRALPIAIAEALHRELVARLPFAPTKGQLAAMADLRADLGRSVPMRRLLQGDVGSGKTAVGLYVCMAAAAAGGQAAFMAPTELLAEQHAYGQRDLLARAGLRAALLSGSLGAKERKAVLTAAAGGQVDVVFGTHALFSEDVRFARLALAVIDEQQRFGVAQRQRLLEKGRDVHALLMTATPIPRSLALTVYGDLDLTLLAEKPPGRGPVHTRWLRGPETRRALEMIEARLAAGEQAYWVVPRIEEDEPGMAGAVAAFERLRTLPVARFGIELVHGRMPAAERAERLERFRRGEARLLVSTTVIEVGVDVPRATVLAVQSAERLGLAQLHQLRGRIGRSERESWCFLLGRATAAERFRVLESTNDGFEIAERDLALRGMGDLVGLRQAGESGLGDLRRDLDLLLFARDLVARAPALRAHYLRDTTEAMI
jgi:ATP-dependent DNA helicase RecG